MKREFLMLAQKYTTQDIKGWWWSEKLDGMRAYWDGGVSRGRWADEVPYANTEKDSRLKERVKATGLWSRYAKVVRAPDWWLDKLPPIPLDGELYMGRGNFQRLRSTVSAFGNDAWQGVEYRVIDSPNRTVVWGAGEVGINGGRKIVFPAGVLTYLDGYEEFAGRMQPFREIYTVLQSRKDFWNDVCVLHEQHSVPLAGLGALLDGIVEQGGEGIIVRNPSACWLPQRTHNLLKMKPFNDAEAMVVGYTTGRATDKGSKLLGMMGALKVRWEGKYFELSGFTDSERELTCPNPETDYAYKWAALNPDTECPSPVWAKHFPRGTLVTFRYRELTDDGIPKEAKYWRKRDVLDG